jgi:hypothetical protein
MSHRGGTEGADKEFLINKYSELCELGVSVVNRNSKLWVSAVTTSSVQKDSQSRS